MSESLSLGQLLKNCLGTVWNKSSITAGISWTLGVGMMLPVAVQAEPPSVTSLFPAGLQQGTTAQIKINGKPGTLPLSAWTTSTAAQTTVVSTAVSLSEGSPTGESSETASADSEPPSLQAVVSEKGDEITVTVPVNAAPGLHWIRFYNADGATELFPLMVGTVPELAEKEPNDSLSQAQSLESLPITINGILSKSNEVDTFAVTLQKGQQLIASADANRSLASPIDAILQVLDSQGFVCAQNHDDRGLDPLLTYHAPADGTFYVRIFCFPSAPNSSIAFSGGAHNLYRLTITNGPFVGYQVPLVPTPAPEGASETVATAGLAEFGWNLSSAETTAQAPGVHHLMATTMNSLPAQKYHAPANDLPIPAVVWGLVSAQNPVSASSWKLEKNAFVRIRVHARALDSLLDPVLRIRDQSQKVVREVDDINRDNLDIDLSWKAPAQGTYTFEVIDRFAHSSPRHFYVLQVETEQPRYDLTVEKEAFVIPAGKPLEIPVTISRLHGYSQEIAVQAVGLPETITAETVVSPAKGDESKKVTLKLTASSPTVLNFPFQIVGNPVTAENKITENKTSDALAIAIPATVALKAPAARTAALWLTAQPQPAAGQ